METKVEVVMACRWCRAEHFHRDDCSLALKKTDGFWLELTFAIELTALSEIRRTAFNWHGDEARLLLDTWLYSYPRLLHDRARP